VVSQSSIGAMDCYVTVQESGKHLTLVAELPLNVLVVTVTVLPSINIPPPCKGETISVITLQRCDGSRFVIV
jgi:hypothetical protein